MRSTRLGRAAGRVLTLGGAADALADADADADGGGPTLFSGVFGVVLVGVWLVYLADPVVRAWQNRDEASGEVALLALVGFALLYLLHFWWQRDLSWGARPTAGGPRWVSSGVSFLRWCALAALAAVATSLVGQDAATTWVFLAVAGLWTFRVPVGHVVSVLLVVLYEVLSFHLATWHHDIGVSFAIILAVTAVTGGMVAGQRQRALEQARRENARLALEEERNRMARDVHDILGHSLTVITVKAELAARLIDADPARARTEVADVERLSRGALADVRRVVDGYREISLSGELARAREALAAARITAELPAATDDVQPDLREVCAWTVREGVTNVIRHSGASRCAVTLGRDGVAVTDDGRGPTGGDGRPGTAGGHGLVGLRERAAAVGAVVRTRRLSPHGFELTVSLSSGPSPRGRAPGAGPSREGRLTVLRGEPRDAGEGLRA